MKPVFFLWLILFCATACNTNSLIDTNPIAGQFQKGILILDQGTSTGTLDFVQTDSMTIKNDIFQLVNPTGIGVGVSSLLTYGNNLYIIVAGENKIIRADRNTLKYENERTDVTGGEMINPRYMTVLNGVAYVSVAGNQSSTSKVLAIDPTTLQTIASIPVSSTPGKLFSYNDFIYVLLNGEATSAGGQIAVIDPDSNTVKTELTIGHNPNGFTASGADMLISCGGHETNQQNDENGSIWTLTPNNTVSQTYNGQAPAQTGFSSIQNINATYDGKIYFLRNGILYVATGINGLSTATVVSQNVYQSLWVTGNTIIALDQINNKADFYRSQSAPVSLTTGINPIAVGQ